MFPERTSPVVLSSGSIPVLRALASHWRLLALASLVALAAAVRIVEITDVPRGFFTDEASFGLNADRILHTGRDEHGTLLPVLFRSFGEYKLPVFIYAEVPFVAIFGRTEEAVRLTSAVLGSLTVIAIYLLAREIVRSEVAALASAAFLAIMPWHVHYSRTGLGDIVVLPLFFCAGFYLFFRAVEDRRYLVPAAVVIALCFYCYRGGWAVIPPIGLLMIVAYRRELWAARGTTATAAGAFALLLLPLAAHLLMGESDRASQAWIFNRADDRSTFGVFVDQYRSYYTRSFLFENGDNGLLLRHYLPGQGMLYHVQAPLILAGLAAMALRFNRRFLFVIALLVFFPLTASVSDTSPVSSRAIHGSVTFALLSGAGLWAVVGFIAARAPGGFKTPIAGFAVIVVASLALGAFASYTVRYHDEYALRSDDFWGWQDGPQAIVTRFEAVEGRYDELYMDPMFNAPDIFFRFYAGDDGCKKCLIGLPDRYRPERRQLFALRPETLAAYDDLQVRVLDRIYYADGRLAFLFVEFGEPA